MDDEYELIIIYNQFALFLCVNWEIFVLLGWPFMISIFDPSNLHRKNSDKLC